MAYEEPEFQEFLERVEPSEVEEGILELQCFKALVARFEEFLARRCEKLGFQKWSYVFELSTKSEDKGRIHIHAYWHTDETRAYRRPWVGTTAAWTFEGSRLLLKINTAKGQNSKRSIDFGPAANTLFEQ